MAPFDQSADHLNSSIDADALAAGAPARPLAPGWLHRRC